MNSGGLRGRAAQFLTKRGWGMTKMRRVLVIVAGLAMVAVVSLSHSQGEPGNPKAGPVVRPVVPVQERNFEQELADSKFASGGVITYRTLKGENFFALQLK